MANRKNIEDTAEYARFLLVKKYIQSNKKYFSVGKQLGADKVMADFGVALPRFNGTTQQNLTRALTFSRTRSSWQNRFNRVLAQRGLYMSQSKNIFYIKTKAATKKKVKTLLVDAARKTARSTELDKGVKQYNCIYSKVKKAELIRIVRGVIRTSY